MTTKKRIPTGKEFVFRNRYNDEIKLLRVNKDTVTVSGGSHYRAGVSDGRTTFFDPSGGPFIALGGDISDLFSSEEEFKPLYVTAINIGGGMVTLSVSEEAPLYKS